jgi:hypothetical protein
LRRSARTHGPGRAEPLTHRTAEIPDIDLRIELAAFVPAATGTCYGTRDGSGAIFFQGLIQRAADQFDVLVTFRGQLDGTRMSSLEELLDVNVTMRNTAGMQLLGERRRLSPLQRQ